MYFIPPIFHLFLILATVKGNSKLPGSGVVKLLGRKQKEDFKKII